jgi:hypothetical protein
MLLSIKLLFFFSKCILVSKGEMGIVKSIFEDFKVSREILMRKEREHFLGSNTSLNQDEQFA